MSGGVDSSYVAMLVHKLGLRILGVHLDNGWNTDESVNNIRNISEILNIELLTETLDFNEFKKMQLAFLNASTPDTEILTDHAIKAVLYKMAKKYGVKYIIAGTNYATESINGPTWSQGHYDWRYIKSVNKLYGNKIKKFPHRSLFNIYTDMRIKYISILDYYDYNKEKAKDEMKNEIGWIDYGRKHGESIFTRIFQEYILPVKFGYDKRRGHYSSLILANQMTREDAILELKKNLYESKEKLNGDLNHLCNKLNISRREFDDMMNLPLKSINDYPNRNDLLLYKFIQIIKKCRSKFSAIIS